MWYSIQQWFSTFLWSHTTRVPYCQHVSPRFRKSQCAKYYSIKSLENRTWNKRNMNKMAVRNYNGHFLKPTNSRANFFQPGELKCRFWKKHATLFTKMRVAIKKNNSIVNKPVYGKPTLNSLSLRIWASRNWNLYACISSLHLLSVIKGTSQMILIPQPAHSGSCSRLSMTSLVKRLKDKSKICTFKQPVWLTTTDHVRGIDVARGDPGTMPPNIFSISSHCVLRNGIPNKNTVARLKSSIFAPQKFWAGYATGTRRRDKKLYVLKNCC